MDLTLNDLLKECIKAGGSDLHVSADSCLQIRVDGHLVHLTQYGVIDAEMSKKLCYEVLSPERIEKFEAEREMDLSFTYENQNRIRVNIYQQQETVAGAFRVIPLKIPNPKDIGIPDIVMSLTKLPRGLVLVTGPTGCGKSTTLATMVNKVNETRKDHIVTIEDPIEYMFEQKNCLISQRELGTDTNSFSIALKYILRQDPDVVLIGEMRDLETVQSAITVAETGHLVLTTLHTNNAIQTIDRIIDVFPSHQQPQVRSQLAFILQGVLCQQLIPKIGSGRALAMEIMIPTPAIRNLIRENKIHQLYAQMQMGREETKMRTMDESLAELVNSKQITYEDGFLCCTDKDEFTSLAEKP